MHLKNSSICLFRYCTDRRESSSAPSPLSYLTWAIQRKTRITKATQSWSTLIWFPDQNAKDMHVNLKHCAALKACWTQHQMLWRHFAKGHNHFRLTFGHCKRKQQAIRQIANNQILSYDLFNQMLNSNLSLWQITGIIKVAPSDSSCSPV